jgi:hypothetical protein
VFIDDVGFALLFPSRGIDLPSLFEAASDRPLEHPGLEWGPEAERVWRWKDELPARGRAWYGRFLRGRPSVLSPTLLADLYPWAGRPEDFAEAGLSPEARRIGEIILIDGPTSTAALREALGLEGKRGQARFSRALTELGRGLVVTHFGTESLGAGWPAAVLELTARAFPVKRRMSDKPEERRRRAAGRFVETMIEARPRDLAIAFGWEPRIARQALEELASAGRAETRGQAFRRGSME